jgi:hypothetical protein
MMYSNDLHGEPTLSPGSARFRGFFLRAPPAIVMTTERLAEIERILSEAAGRSRARRLRRRGLAVLFGPEPGQVQLFTDDGEMIFETRTPRWAAAQFVVMVRHASSTLGTAEPLKGLDGAPVLYRSIHPVKTTGVSRLDGSIRRPERRCSAGANSRAEGHGRAWPDDPASGRGHRRARLADQHR